MCYPVHSDEGTGTNRKEIHRKMDKMEGRMMMGGPPNGHVLLPLVEYQKRKELAGWPLLLLLTGIDGAASRTTITKDGDPPLFTTLFLPSLSDLFFYF